MTTAFADPFIHSSALFCDFAAHLLLISGMRVGLALQHGVMTAFTETLSASPGVILDIAEIIAIAAIAARSFFLHPRKPFGRKASVRRKPVRPRTRKKTPQRTRRRHACACGRRKKSK